MRKQALTKSVTWKDNTRFALLLVTMKSMWVLFPPHLILHVDVVHGGFLTIIHSMPDKCLPVRVFDTLAPSRHDPNLVAIQATSCGMIQALEKTKCPFQAIRKSLNKLGFGGATLDLQ
ncbi:hypothetical protein ACOSQ3_000824 [Xanthoceras sorbifolium]